MEKPSAQSLNCANCGAPLEVGPAARFATCAHCNTSLEIKRSDSAAWTELIQQVAKETGQIREELEALRTEQELERLDREWEKEKESLMIKGGDGTKSEPSVIMAIAVLVFVILTVIFGVGIMSSQNSGSNQVFLQHGGIGTRMQATEDNHSLPVCFFVVVVVVGGGFTAIRILGKAQELRDRETAHHEERERLKSRLKRRD